MSHNNLDYKNYKPYLEELDRLIKILNKYDFDVCLDGGTLLGAARNNDLIPTDDDIDIFYISKQNNLTEVLKEFNNKIKPLLERKGYVVEPISWTVRKNKKLLFGQYHITKNDITLDLWASWFNSSDKFYLSHCITGELIKENIYPLKQLKLKDRTYCVPNDYEKLLELLYKKDWRIPDNYRPKPNHYFFQKNILKIIDVYGWAYHFIALDQQKYSIHNIKYCKLADFKEESLENIDIIYFHSPGVGFGRIKNIIKLTREKFKHIKIIGAYAGENRLSYPDSDLIVSISAKHLPYLRYIYRVPPAIFLPECVDTDFFKPPIYKSNRNFIPGFAGRNAPVKRTHLLDKLDFSVKKQMDHSPENFTQDRTLLPMKQFYHSIDCLVLTSKSECMPRTVLEAMSCGLPIISTDVGSLKMLVDEEWLVPVLPEEETVRIMNEKLNKLYNDRELRKQVGKRNRETILKYFNWENNQPIWDDVFSYLYTSNYQKIKEVTDQFNQQFYDKEPALLENAKFIEPPKVEPEVKLVFEEKKEMKNTNEQYKVAICITTFLRDNLLYKTLQTIVDNYTKDCIVLVADEGYADDEKNINIDYFKSQIPLEYYRLPFFCGISTARNFLVNKANEKNIPYILIGADSIQFTTNYNFDNIINFLETDINNGIVGFNLFNYATWRGTINLIEGQHFYMDIPDKAPFVHNNLNLIPVEMCSNFFLAKTKVLLDNKWDDELKLMEFEDFFWRLKTKTNYKVFFTSDIQGRYIHNRTKEYEEYRNLANSQFDKLVCQKYGLKRWVKLSPIFYKHIKKEKR